jgi:hypothetical protein
MLRKCKIWSPTLKTKQSAYENIWTRQMRMRLEKTMEVKMAKYVVHLDDRTNACSLMDRGYLWPRHRQEEKKLISK